jgi:hypothetical protein
MRRRCVALVQLADHEANPIVLITQPSK